MGRLKAMGGRLKVLAPTIGVATGDRRGVDRNRDRMAPWRAWYGTPRWEHLRLEVFVRDNFTCQQTGALLFGKHPAPNSPVAHHIRAHKGDPDLFWDIGNIETVSKAWHDGEAQRQERAPAQP